MHSLLEKTERFVSRLFENELPETFIYHNYTHTKRVFKSTKEIIQHSAVSDEDETILLLAVLLHDTGYTKSIHDHEEHSVTIAREFLMTEKVSEAWIESISKLILATKMEYQPTHFLEEIIRDADSSHFAKPYYQETCELLRKELKLHDIKEYSFSDWLKTNIAVFKNVHSYYTPYAKEYWEPKKQENLRRLLDQQASMKKKKKKNLLKKILKEESPEKGIQTAFRVTLRNHLKLSDIADTKANILLSVNAIIISLALSNLIPKLDNPSNAYLIYPTLIFVIFSIVSMILSVLATRPNVTGGEFTKKEVEERKVNLLFFGNFHKMPLEEYKSAMHQLMEDKEYIYDTMIKDLYFLGKVLHKKYKILRVTYTVFMLGIIVSVLAFVIAFKMTQLN